MMTRSDLIRAELYQRALDDCGGDEDAAVEHFQELLDIEETDNPRFVRHPPYCFEED